MLEGVLLTLEMIGEDSAGFGVSQGPSHSLEGQSFANLMMDTLFVNNLLILKGKNDGSFRSYLELPARSRLMLASSGSAAGTTRPALRRALPTVRAR